LSENLVAEGLARLGSSVYFNYVSVNRPVIRIRLLQRGCVHGVCGERGARL